MTGLKPYPVYKDSGVEWLGRIPASWGVKRLKYVAPARTEKRTERPEDLPYLGLEQIESRTGRLLLDTPVENVDSTVSAFNPGDVLFGKLRPYLAKVAHVDFAGVCTSELLVFRSNESVQARFLFYQLLCDDFIRLVNASTYGTKMPRASPEQIGNMALPVVPDREQHAIASFLDRETAKIDALVAKKERLIELLQEKRAALITQAVTKGLDPTVRMKDSGVEWLGKIPSHWEVWRLKHVSGGLTVGVVVNPSQYVSASGAPFLRGVDVTEGRILLDRVQYMSDDANQLHCKSTLRAGDLITIRVGYPGVTAIVPAELDRSNCASLLITRQSPRVHSQLLCYLMNSAVGKAQFKMLQDGAAQEQINVSDAVDFLVPLPPIDEQASIVKKLDAVTAKLDALTARAHDGIEKLKEYRTALISAAVTGKIDVLEDVAG
jgi:type I restriction enzyme S subunit